MNANVIRAIFRRNFSSYFSNPTGYVFICVFVLLSSFAAFWPNDFFTSNLANLDQLNKYLPYILLVFIPAITMSIWAEERRQGTDELLLTIPAADIDVVLGKYLAAVAIYTVALVFSMVCNMLVLWSLGAPDMGLLLGTYFGYWMVGLAMLAVGMVASFLTANLTVGFVLGALFNAPLTFAAAADAIPSPSWLLQRFPDWAQRVRGWSLEGQFEDFGRGVISLSSVAYFGLLVVVMLYLSMVLIGRRHWQGGRDGASLGGHYFVRALALVVAAAVAIGWFSRVGARVDVTEERLSSLSSSSRQLLAELKPENPILIEAFISPQVPEGYVQTRLNLLSMLRELEAQGGSKVKVRINHTEPLSDEADRAEQQFSIESRQVESRTRGALKLDDIYLGVAVVSGLKKVRVPFFDRGIPVEYELIRSICTVSEQVRRRIGVLTTDAQLFGGFNPQTMSPRRNEAIVDELQKQYEVEQVSADEPITGDFDVLLAVQPSSLSPPQMQNFLAAVRRGQPTAIFEDPFPALDQMVVGTSMPKQPQRAANPFMGGGGPPQPKGDINQLWSLLEVGFTGAEVVYQNYNPFPKWTMVSPEWVFVDDGASEFGEKVFSDTDPTSSNLQQMLFLFPGAVIPKNASQLKCEPLVWTGKSTGYLNAAEILEPAVFGTGGGLNPRRRQVPTAERYILAAHVHGTPPTENLPQSGAPATPPESPAAPAAEAPSAEAGAATTSTPVPPAPVPSAAPVPPAAAATSKPINVILVGDIDILYSAFFFLRSQGVDPEREFNASLDNVTFVLNVLDQLAGDSRFIEIRKRRTMHRTLTEIEDKLTTAREAAFEKTESFRRKFDEEKSKAQKALDDEIEKLQKRDDLSSNALSIEVAIAQQAGNARLTRNAEKLEDELQKSTKQIESSLARDIRRVEDGYKLAAVLIPPIPPLLVALAVFFQRRARESEGVSRARLR